MDEKLILASTSPFRAELLSRLGIPFETVSPLYDEDHSGETDPHGLAAEHALGKALAVAKDYPGRIVIGSDQVAEVGGELLGKPHTFERAVGQLRAMSGREVRFHTAVAVVRGDHVERAADIVTVRLRELSDGEIRDYVAREEPLGCAGSFKIEGLGIALMEEVSSTDFTSLVGLPLIKVTTLLKRFGVEVLGG